MSVERYLQSPRFVSCTLVTFTNRAHQIRSHTVPYLDGALRRREGTNLEEVVPRRHPFGRADVGCPPLERAAVRRVTVVLLQAPLELGVQSVAVLVLCDAAQSRG